jgi:hypothetical protein
MMPTPRRRWTDKHTHIATKKNNSTGFGEKPFFQHPEAQNGAMTVRFGTQTGPFFVFCTQKQAVLQVLPKNICFLICQNTAKGRD